MAVTRFEAILAVVSAVEKCVLSVVPSTPPASEELVQEKPVSVSPKPMLLLPAAPLVRALTVTEEPLLVADTPNAVGQALIAVVRLVASVEVVLLMAKLPLG